MIKAVIFDMDGLMIDTEPLQSKSFEHVLKSHGKVPVFNKDGVIQVVGIRSKDNWLLLKEKHNIEASLESLIEKKRKIYKELLKKNLNPKKGLLSLIKELHNKGLKLAIASSSTLDHIMTVVQGLGLEKYFDAIISGESLKYGKPYPDIFLKAAKSIKIKPENCLVLEDAESGVIAAKAAGMKVIAVPNQYTKTHDFSKADRVVNSLEKIDSKLLQNMEN